MSAVRAVSPAGGLAADVAGPPGYGEFRVVRGQATDEEVAAVVALLACLASAAAAAPEGGEASRPVRRWAAPATRMTRFPTGRGPGAWRSSGRM
ncbi:acyl-CoA carboxylase subunit epsilon [Streptomyces sp. NPDC054841]